MFIVLNYLRTDITFQSFINRNSGIDMQQYKIRLDVLRCRLLIPKRP